MFRFIYKVFFFLVLLILPFVILLRTASYLHVNYSLSPWSCIALSTFATAILMFLYFTFFYGKLTGRVGDLGALKRRFVIAILLVIIYAIQGLVLMNNKNLKSPELRTEVLGLHPILRLSLSTLVSIDNDLVITDATRNTADYKNMGLKTNERSLHYKQKSTGFAHAVDLRTKGKAEWKNVLINIYFRSLGFNTLRHKGTADHLHVSLFSEDHPHSK